MDKYTLTKEIAERILNIKSYISYFEQMSRIRPECPFGPILNSLQISIYIELFNLVDTNNSKEHNIYALFSKADNEVEYQKRMSKYKKDIESIKRRRNDVIAHVSGLNGCEVFKKYPISNLKQMLQDIFDICYEIDPSVRRIENEYISMINQFDLFIEKTFKKRR